MRLLTVLACAGLLGGGSHRAAGQAQRVRDTNTIGWYVYEGDHQLGVRWTLHTEYQWRRVQLIRDAQQTLARLGAAYQLAPRVSVAAGYTSLITHPYGDYPTAGTGAPFPERRLYQDVQLSDTLGWATLLHRVRLEQCWQGQLPEGGSRAVQAWNFQNRIRYQLGVTLPLQGPRLNSRGWYLTGFDEVFLSFGKRVGSNVFNQNRVAGGVGYQFSKACSVAVLYLNQITQHADSAPTTGLPVFEFNHGIRLNVNYDLVFVK